MLDDLEIKGYWFFPGVEGQSFLGTLNFKPAVSIRLHINVPVPLEALSAMRLDNLLIIGYSLMMEPITLIGCNLIASNASAAFGINGIEFTVFRFLKGYHLKNENDKVFSEARIALTGMENWMQIFGFTKISVDGTRDFELKYSKPPNVNFEIPGNIKGYISFWNDVPFIMNAKIKLQQDNYVGFEFPSPVNYSEVTEILWSFQQFLSILMWQKVAIRWYILSVDKQQTVNLTSIEQAMAMDAYFFYRQTVFSKVEEDNSDYLFTYKKLSEQFPKIVSKWYELQDIKPSIDILHANIGIPPDHVRNNFLNMAQAVEAYHRRRIQDTANLKEENNKKMQRILMAITDLVDQEWLQQKLAYSYEPSLRTRLKALFKEHGSVFLNNSNKKTLDSVIQFILDKRNYFTHFDDTNDKHGSDSDNLYQYVELMKMLLTVCLLKDVGLTSAFIAESLPNRRRIRFSAQKYDE